MNSDIIEDGQLKKGLTEKVDFELLNEKTYQYLYPFNNDNSKINKRFSVMIGK
jgi:hypothetical protein